MIEKPNYTQMPNVVLDNIASMSESELKIVIAVCRKTFGWHKQRDRLSLSQLERLTGLSRPGVIAGIDRCIANGWIARHPSGDSFEYELLVNSVDSPQSTQLTPLVNQVDYPLVNQVDTQKKEVKETNQKKEEAAAPADATFESVKKLYTQNIGLPTPIILDSLRDACALYTPQWVDMAIREAVVNSARSWRYIITCLESWRTNGLKHRAERPSDRRGPARRMAPAPTKTIHDCFNVRQINALYRANMTGAQAQHIVTASLTYEAALAYVTGVQNGGSAD